MSGEVDDVQVPGEDPLPSPTGRRPVGRVSLEWVDPKRAEIYASNPADRRELVVWVWYPAAPDPRTDHAGYLAEPWHPIAEFLGLDIVGVRSHAVPDAAVSEDAAVYPVLVLSPSGFPPVFLSAVAEELASHGYVVVGVNHTYEPTVTAFSDGRIVTANPAALGGALGPQTGSHEDIFRQRAALCDYKAADLASVADRLERLETEPAAPIGGRVDLTRLGAFGHSFGGNAALEWCRTDPRCRAAVNLDGTLWNDVGRVGLDRPALEILAQHPEFALSGDEAVRAGLAQQADWHDADRAMAYNGWRTVHHTAQPGYTVQIDGATHLSFMDIPFLPVRQASPVRAMLAAMSIEPRRMWRITSDLLIAFFSRHLDGGSATMLDGPANEYPELTFGPP